MEIIKRFISKSFINRLVEVLNKRDDLYKERAVLFQQQPMVFASPIQIDKELNRELSTMVVDLKLTYSFQGVRFEGIYHKSPKKLINGSQPDTYWHLLYGLKYQLIANWKTIGTLNEFEQKCIALACCVKLASNINNSISYHVEYDKRKKEYKHKYYRPIGYDNNENKTYSTLVRQVLSEIKNDDDTVIGLKGTVFHLDKNFESKQTGCINYMKRFTEDQLKSMVFEFKQIHQEQQVTADLLATWYNSNLGEEEYEQKRISPQQLRYYIKMYSMEDMFKFRKRKTKAEVLAIKAKNAKQTEKRKNTFS